MVVAKLLKRLAARPADLQEHRLFTPGLVRELERLPAEALAEVRRGLAELSPAGSERVAGYRAALVDVLAAREALSAEREASAERRETAVREGWRPILRALAAGEERPSGVARLTGLDKGHVSRALGAMQEAGLVTSIHAPHADGRARHFQLTLEGERIAAQLGREPEVLAPPVRAVVSWALRLFGQFRVTRRLPRPAAERQAAALLAGTGVDPTVLCDALASAAAREGVFREIEGTWLVESVGGHQGLKRQLRAALHGGSTPVFLQALIASAPPGADILIRATSESEKLWQACLVRESSRRLQLVDWAAMHLDEVTARPGAYKIVVYDSSNQLRADQDAYPDALRAIEAVVDRKLCVKDSPAETLPRGFDPVELRA